jgi:hypothetical protein
MILSKCLPSILILLKRYHYFGQANTTYMPLKYLLLILFLSHSGDGLSDVGADHGGAQLPGFDDSPDATA